MESYHMFGFVVVLIGSGLVLGLTASLFQDIVTGWFQRRAAIRKTYGIRKASFSRTAESGEQNRGEDHSR